MIRRARDKAAALEYAKSQGWVDSVTANLLAKANGAEEALERGQQVAVDALAELEARLAAEVESHAVTKRALTRGTRKRVAELEAALREIFDAPNANEEHVAIEKARAVLG